MRSKHPPDGSLIRAIASRPFSWKLALCEWIDNSLDAASDVSKSKIDIRIGREVQIKDNSLGTDRLASMVQIGSHNDHSATQIGEFGQGAKDAALYVGRETSVVTIESTHKGFTRRLTCDWQDYARCWELDEPTVEEARPGDVGTLITVSPRSRDTPHGRDWAKLIAEIGYIYSIAIKKGARLSIQGPTKNAELSQVPRWEFPEFEGEVVDQVVSVGEKRARVFCGVVKSGVNNIRSGLTYFSAFRVVLPESANGCGTHNIARVCGFVELFNSKDVPKRHRWALGTNKSEIIDKDADALFVEVERACRSVLLRAASAGSVLASQAFENAVSASVGSGVEGAEKKKAIRGKGDKHGSQPPTNSGRKHKQASVTQPGQTFPEIKPAGVIVTHQHLGDDKGFGEIKGATITLNLDVPAIAAALSTKNHLATIIAASALVGMNHCLALTLTSERGKQLALRTPADPKNFSEAVADVLKGASLDGREAAVLPRIAAVA